MLCVDLYKKERKKRQCAIQNFLIFLYLKTVSENSISFCLLNLAQVTVADEEEHSTPFQGVGEAGSSEAQVVAEALVYDFADSMLIGDDSS